MRKVRKKKRGDRKTINEEGKEKYSEEGKRE